MIPAFDWFRQFSFASVLARLLLTLVCGTVIGYGRTRRHSEAGIRTYVCIALGAALSVLITLYEYRMLQTAWSAAVAEVGLKFDASRLAAQAISGIGFLAAGMILKGAFHKVRGLTTATGMFAAVCMSLAAGAGYVECVLTVLVLIVLTLDLLVPMETRLMRRANNLTLIVELERPDDTAAVLEVMEEQNAQIFEVELEPTENSAAAVFAMKLADGCSRAAMLSRVAQVECVRSVEERL